MNILIDYLASNTGGGKTVAENQINNLLRLDKKNKYICLFSEGNRILESEYGNCKVIYVKNDSLIKRLWYQKIRIPVLIRDYNVDVLFCPNNYSLYFDKNVKTVIMYQNSNIFFSIFLGKNLLVRLKYLIIRLLSEYSKRKSDVNLFVSKFIKNGNNGKVVYLGIENNDNIIYENFKNEKEYDVVLILSNFSVHKNIKTFVDSIEYYQNKYKKKLKVLIVGGDRDLKKIKYVKEYIENKNSLSVMITGLIPKKAVRKYILKSKLYVSTSLLEAFSLTQFEALNCNIPILLSDIPVFREVCGDSDIYFNPKDPENIADKIHDVFENYEYYVNMISKIKKYASKFTWENHARKLIEIFESVYANFKETI